MDLIAIGYTMVYGIIGMINFAHGDIFMIGAFVCFNSFYSFWINRSSLTNYFIFSFINSHAFYSLLWLDSRKT